ncbi:MAG: uncharacterized protein PWQ82_616 [Thermosediminibacterales bacterium]|nr:uncharacterized protein [Thermosediminibacterales bacterium]MDK2835542.1 uncharacterized protein [Thermosediminibacterales bacterium]
MPVLVKFLIVFTIMIVLLRKKVNLGIVMLIDSVVLGLLFKMDIFKISQGILQGMFSYESLHLIGVLIFIMFLENTMRKEGHVEKILNSLEKLVGDYRVVMAILPAFIGLLPSAGGALFSAPMVQEASRENDVSPERKAFINYWYRHMWEYSFPLYPAILFTSEILDIELIILIKSMIVFSLAVVLLGIPFGFTNLHNNKRMQEDINRWPYFKELVNGIYPVVLIIVLYLLFKIDLLIDVGLIFLLLTLLNRYKLEDYKRVIKESFPFKIVFLIFGIMAFKNMLALTEALDILPGLFSQMGIPVVAVFFILPFFIGFLTGMSSAYVAITFPILAAFQESINLSAVSFAFVSGFAGVMLSPMHLCLLLSADYFKADLTKVLIRVAIPEALLVSLALVFYLIF